MSLKNLAYYLRAKLGTNESGQDLLEYALLVALIALVSVGVITSAGTGVKTIFTEHQRRADEGQSLTEAGWEGHDEGGRSSALPLT